MNEQYLSSSDLASCKHFKTKTHVHVGHFLLN